MSTSLLIAPISLTKLASFAPRSSLSTASSPITSSYFLLSPSCAALSLVNEALASFSSTWLFSNSVCTRTSSACFSRRKVDHSARPRESSVDRNDLSASREERVEERVWTRRREAREEVVDSRRVASRVEWEDWRAVWRARREERDSVGGVESGVSVVRRRGLLD